jgi:ABC-2 type transport system ATP-binding protein
MNSNNADTGSTAISMQDTGFTYSDGTEAVNGLTLEVPEGEFFGFLGPNGAGKTTTIKMLVTLLQPTNGRIIVNGSDADSDPHRVRNAVGYMAQETSIDLDLTARENLRFACDTHHVPKADRAERIAELLELVDLADVADKQADTFSGGMKKRLEWRPHSSTTPLVFLDEPTTGLNPRVRNRLWEYFRGINDKGTTLFLTTQYLEEADELCDRLAVIVNGEIVATGSPAELKATVGGDILEIDIVDATDAQLDCARTAVQNADVLDSDESVSADNDSITVTSQPAREIAPDVIVASGTPVSPLDSTCTRLRWMMSSSSSLVTRWRRWTTGRPAILKRPLRWRPTNHEYDRRPRSDRATPDLPLPCWEAPQ